MLKLSILIAAGDEALFETTLASVLQNRPADCEIVVVCDEGYSDPYSLAGEVRFLSAPADYDELARLNRGLSDCRASIVHILRCGTEVTEGWTAVATAHFADPHVASVAPLLVAQDGKHVAAAGVDYHRGGKRLVRECQATVDSLGDAPTPILGPTLAAAFYRLSALRTQKEVFCAAVGCELADVDLALRLARGGQRGVFDPRSRVVAGPAIKRGNPLAAAWLAERLFWRHAGGVGRLGALLSHGRLIAAETAMSMVRPLHAGRIIGRAAGIVERLMSGAPATRKHSAGLQPPSRPAGSRLRVDQPANGPGPKRKSRQEAPRAA